MQNYITDILLGVAVGDAIGVPAEFRSREHLSVRPMTDIMGHGSHNQPAGTWSDDTSLTLALADALCEDFDLQRIADNFVAWKFGNKFTARGEVFDIGITTRNSIYNLRQGVSPTLAGADDETQNGNGSLMRILPLLAYIKDKPMSERFEITKEVSSITHGHIRAAMACFYYLEFARKLLEQKDKFQIYKELQTEVKDFFQKKNLSAKEIDCFRRLLEQDIADFPDTMIHSSGYVIHSLEASIWCLLTTINYKDAILDAVNLGEDTDTTAAITGGLAGLLYGADSIPQHWLLMLARREYIEDLGEKLFETLKPIKYL
jgi:ADP-ribosyl-[dinitrogen reductase] hydrolase